jgi:hypothetical protein
MEKATLIKNLQDCLKAFERNPIPQEGIRDSAEFYNLNTAIRHGLTGVGEDPYDPETLQNRGLLIPTADEPIPESYIRGVRSLIADLQDA